MQILFPTGRMIGGSMKKLYPRKDDNGIQKLTKTGEPATSFVLKLAIPKGSETHWSQTTWGAQVFKIGEAAYPDAHRSLAFAWKITDGDSTAVDKEGKRPCDKAYYKGNWIVNFNQPDRFPEARKYPELTLIGHDQILCGYHVMVIADVKTNAPAKSPGVYVNPVSVALVAEDDEIVAEVDTKLFQAAGAVSLPATARPLSSEMVGFPASTTPFSGFTPAAPVPVPVAAPPPPNPAFLQVPPPPVARKMTALAKGASYESLIANGWTEALLLQHGLMLP